MTKLSDNFTLLRLILALLVVFSHSYSLDGRPEPTIFGMTVGSFAVQCFFVISGYLIVGSYLTTKEPVWFVWKRVLRILPALVIAVPGSLLLYGWQVGFAGNPIHGFPNLPLWTIPWEALMYVLTLLLGMTGMLIAPVISAAWLTGLMLFFFQRPSTLTIVIAIFFLLFTAGGMIKLSESQFDLSKCAILAYPALALALLPIDLFEPARLYGGNMWFAWGPDVPWGEMRRLTYVIALPFAVLFVARRFPVSLPIRSDYSYGIYIWAWPIQETLVYQAVKHEFALGPRTLFIASAILSFACAFVSWHLVEKNAVRLSHRKISWRAYLMWPARWRGERV
jgi:peptidoglycan/LPS O-acetylase OafA/YrhL